MDDEYEHYDPESGDRRLDLLMKLAFAGGRAVAVNEELRVPVLVAAGDDITQELGVFNLVTNAAPVADMARVLIYATGATRAAICFEGWEYQASFDRLTPADEEAIKRGRVPAHHIRPSQHPDRYDVLSLVGQVHGQVAVYRSWRIEPGSDGQRVLTYRPPHASAELAPSNFNPLFVSLDVVRKLVRKYAELERLRDVARSERN